MSQASSPKKIKADDDNYHLLMKDPSKFVEVNQPLIKKMVQYFQVKGFIREQEVEDYIQSINEKLLTDRVQKMQLQYNASVKLHLYFTKIVFNLCRELLRVKRKEENVHSDTDFVEHAAKTNPAVITNLIIDDELKRLDIILRTYFKNRAKLCVVLKLLCRIPLKNEDIKRYCSDLPPKEIKQILSRLHKDYVKLNNKEVYERFKLLFNRCEHKTSSADSIRKWVEARITNILHLMNERLNQQVSAQYTKETLIILLHKYFERNEFGNSNFG